MRINTEKLANKIAIIGLNCGGTIRKFYDENTTLYIELNDDRLDFLLDKLGSLGYDYQVEGEVDQQYELYRYQFCIGDNTLIVIVKVEYE